MSTTSLETTTTLSSLTSSSPNTGSTLPTTSAPVTTPAPSLEVPTSALNRPEVIAALIGASILVLVLCLFCVFILCRYRRRRRDLLNQTPPSNESHDLLPDDMRERDIPPSQDRRFDIENPAPAHLGKANGIPLFPHLKTLQLLTRTTSVVSSASTLVSRPSTSNSKENPEIHIERAYTLQPPIADHNSNYLSDKELGKKRGRDSVSTEAYETIMYSQRSPQWDNSVAKRFSTASTIRFARFSRGWGLRSSAMSSDRVTVFDEGNHQTSPSPTSAQSPRSAKSPSMLRRTSQMAFGRGRGSVAYKKLSPSESPQPDAIKFPPTEEVPEETAYQTTPLAPPPVRMKPRSQTPNNHGGSTSERGIAADESTSTSQWDRGHTRPDPGKDVTIPQPGMSILASAIAKGKVTRQEAETVLGMPFKSTK